MSFNLDIIYTHKYFVDVVVKVKGAIHLPEGVYLWVSWYLKNGRPLGVVDSIFISKAQLPNWSEVYK